MLAEMPYLEIGDQVTDLELEKIKSKDQFITYMKYFFGLSKGTPTDKYKSRLKFKNRQERERIKQKIISNNEVQVFIKTIGISHQDLVKILKDL